MTSPDRGFLLRIFAAAAVFAALMCAAPVAQADERYAAIVMDARSGEVLLDDHAEEMRYPASLTKMMTLYMVFDALRRGEITLDTRLTASRNAARQPPSRLGLRRGNSINVDQAIRAIAVLSANDVATMVAERLGGSESRFAAEMTARARSLGMTETRFVNASGLPDPLHHSTARDLAILAQALWRDFPQYYGYFQTESFSWGRRDSRNHNHLLGQVQGLDGIKTGYTRASGFNLATSTERAGHRVIVVVLGGESAAARDSQVEYLIDGAFEEFARRTDPNAAQLASLPTHRLDIRLAPSVLSASAGGTSLARPGVPQGQVVQTLSPIRAPLPPDTTAPGADEDPND
ncbi:MAG: D-alanyl-D-alanine carboxypeptidase [Proteobacteria bacterium]|nr:D-alanyl-D-alanine carboxypeptidase [Pseudomonadota bacterium]